MKIFNYSLCVLCIDFFDDIIMNYIEFLIEQ